MSNIKSQTAATAFIIIYAAAMVCTQLFDPDRGRYGQPPLPSIPSMARKTAFLTTENNPVARDKCGLPLSAWCRQLDYSLPPSCRIFLADILGPGNEGRYREVYFLTYHLFPREVAVSTDGKPWLDDATYFMGKAPRSIGQLQRLGYHIAIRFLPNGRIMTKTINKMPTEEPPPPQALSTAAPMATLLLIIMLTITAAAALKKLTPADTFSGKWETAACGLALGLLALTQIDFAARLAGIRPEWWLAWSVIVAGVTVTVSHAAGIKTAARRWLRNTDWRWRLAAAPLAALFAMLFLLNAHQGVMEFDAVASWLLKAKMIHCSTGGELIDWFSTDRLWYAHLDYPPLLPTLYAVTWGMLGQVNEFVLKLWPVSMLLLTLGTIYEKTGENGMPRIARIALLYALAFNPAILRYVNQEGATIPMVFMLTIGGLQIIDGLTRQNKTKTVLGLWILLAAALTKNEGMLALAAWSLVLLAMPLGRKIIFSLKKRVIAANALAVIIAIAPFAAFRCSIPTINDESKWLASMRDNPRRVISNYPQVFPIHLARQFLDDGLLAFSAPDKRHVQWTGAWRGLKSLIDWPTLGLWWLALAAAAAALIKNRRSKHDGSVILALTAVPAIFFPIMCLTFSCLHRVVRNVFFATGGGMDSRRILFPICVAWLAGSALFIYRKTMPGQEKIAAETAGDRQGGPNEQTGNSINDDDG